MTPEQNKRFKYWQTRTILATMIGYALFYFVRKNFSLAMPGLEADLGISKTSLGIFLTLNGVIYGFSRFFNGILADRMNARWYMSIGLALCALSNLAFGFGEDISYWITGEHDGSQFTNTMVLFMGVMWVVNGLLQGTGFPPCARLLTHWIPPTELATKMSWWNTSHSIGAGLVVILCGYVMGTMGMNMTSDSEAVERTLRNLHVGFSLPTSWPGRPCPWPNPQLKRRSNLRPKRRPYPRPRRALPSLLSNRPPIQLRRRSAWSASWRPFSAVPRRSGRSPRR